MPNRISDALLRALQIESAFRRRKESKEAAADREKQRQSVALEAPEEAAQIFGQFPEGLPPGAMGLQGPPQPGSIPQEVTGAFETRFGSPLSNFSGVSEKIKSARKSDFYKTALKRLEEVQQTQQENAFLQTFIPPDVMESNPQIMEIFGKRDQGAGIKALEDIMLLYPDIVDDPEIQQFLEDQKASLFIPPLGGTP